MEKTNDILREKAKDSNSLKDTISVETTDISKDEMSGRPALTINEKGEKVLVFSDPLYSREKRSVVNYAVFKGKWEFENIDELEETDEEKCAVKFTPTGDNSNITIAFKSLKDRVEFMDSIYSDHGMKQIGSGINLEYLANSKVLKTTGGIIGLSLLGYGLYKLLGKEKND
ncbi:MAG: hypothetical protein NTX22_04095 [Ignavibacteriales bacterium]|nr:hypothetical protein [Ignavibacteriales bacterium]